MIKIELLLYVLILIIPISASLYIRSSYNKFSRISNTNKKSGVEIAREILDANGLESVHVVEVQGNLTDHYDPTRKVVRLSTNVFHGETIASSAVAAHEVGHAIQDKENNKFLRIRSTLFPFVKITSNVAYVFLILSIILEQMGMFWLSISLMIFSLSFQLVTLPVEFDASEKAKTELRKLNLVSPSEAEGVRKMLKSAAMTYVAGLAASILEILRLILIFNRRD